MKAANMSAKIRNSAMLDGENSPIFELAGCCVLLEFGADTDKNFLY
jgi:hypothetical protein